ncbi:MAG: manganese efflux pump [Anaerolineae bacterium]|nr:MAG: manganese efflux pump [Anaerolineae bacterium]
MDAFAVSLGVGTSQLSYSTRSKLRLAFHFGVFQAGMTLLGWLGGTTVEPLIRHFDHWIAFALLGYVGGRMIWGGLHQEQESYNQDPTRGGLMVLLSVATSLDALAVGLSMAILRAPVFVPSLVIGLVAFLLSGIGLFCGCYFGERFGKRMEIFGGLLLVAIGLRILLEHLFF